MNICYGSYSQALHVALTLPAVHKSTGCADLLSTKVYRLCKSLPAAQICHTSLPAVQKSTGYTQVYRPCKSLPAVHKFISCTDLPQVLSGVHNTMLPLNIKQ